MTSEIDQYSLEMLCEIATAVTLVLDSSTIASVAEEDRKSVV